MKSLPYISIGLAGLVCLNEIAYIGKTSLAWVVILLGIAIGLQGIYLLKK